MTAILPHSATALQKMELEDLLRRAQAGDESTLPQVRQLLWWPAVVERLGATWRPKSARTWSGGSPGETCWRGKASPGSSN